MVSIYVRPSLAVKENYNLTFSHYEDYNKIIVELSPQPTTLWCMFNGLTSLGFNSEQSYHFECGRVTAQAVNESSGPKWIIKVVLQDCHQVQLRCGKRFGDKIGTYNLSSAVTLSVLESEELHNVGSYITYR